MVKEMVLPGKKFWRCTVCNDVHYGVAGPHECPTCHQLDTYVEIDAEEAKKMCF